VIKYTEIWMVASISGYGEPKATTIHFPSAVDLV